MRARSSAATIAVMTTDRTGRNDRRRGRRPHDGYALARTPEEYERLRAQARVWEVDHRAAARPGRARARASRCLDAGCGPGETMRLMAQRVGPVGPRRSASTSTRRSAPRRWRSLHAAGHRQCEFAHADLTAGDAIPGAPFDLVFARLLLFHLPERVARAAAACGTRSRRAATSLVQDYDLRSRATSCRRSRAIDEFGRVVARRVRGRRLRYAAWAHHLPLLFAEAGIGAPDGTDVAGRLEPLADGERDVRRRLPALLPARDRWASRRRSRATAWLSRPGATTPRESRRRAALWPLLIGAWKRK